MTLDFLHAVTGGQSLTEEEAESAMRALLAGESTPVLTAAFLTALRMKGETVDELTGFARAMRAASKPLPIDPAVRPLLDTCGTGGGSKGTFNISTMTAIVVAGAGMTVAKPWESIDFESVRERRRAGSARSPHECNSGSRFAASAFATPELDFFAPAFHTAMKHVQPVRLELKMRDVAFNYLGPLSNPARAEVAGYRDLVRRCRREDCRGSSSGAAWFAARICPVHASDGLGELSGSRAQRWYSMPAGGIP